MVGVAKTLGFALFLRKGFHDPDARDGVGQHVGHFGPDAVDLLEPGAQTIAHGVDHPADEGQRHQRDQRQPWVDGEQNGRRHHDHEHVGHKIQGVEGQEDVDAVRLGANPRHQISRALAAKVVQRQAQQVLVGGGAQVGADALGHQRQDVGARPGEAPGRQG
ncbi:hypothetical protein D3C72_1677990 [compost metagenome]